MQDIQNEVPRQWLTVDASYAACIDAGLDRTKKTIRQWCRQEHIDCQKQTTPTGERWMIEKTSLETKIRLELEFQRQFEQVQTSAYSSEPVRTRDEPVQTRTDRFEQPQTGTNYPANTEDIIKLEAQIKSLEIDKAVRDQHISFLTSQNEKGQQDLLSQSRYIGHLETKVLALGGEPDSKFLAAPVAEVQPDPVHSQ
ncbi:hypothetical protein N9491_06085 [Planktomarina temperata]|nr:hypothetical protein [Planktomarina temperata]